MSAERSSLWRHADFVRLWSGQTISVFGSMIGITAITFTAILCLHATSFQMGVLNSMRYDIFFTANKTNHCARNSHQPTSFSPSDLLG